MPLIEFTDKGLYCPPGNFYIDPWESVGQAVITHAHSDHARPGNALYICHHHSLPILLLRLGQINYQTLEWQETINVNGVKVSLHPAGHVIGSSQVRIEKDGEVWVVSGDYKREDDGISGVFEPIRCNTFITESTFGLPIYKWKQQTAIFNEMREWILQNNAAGKRSVLIAYSFGKTQRVIKALEGIADNILVHGAIWNVHETLRQAGWKLPEVKRITPELTKQDYQGSVIVAPPSATGIPWMRKFNPYSVGICSGWMQVRGNQRRSNGDAGFVLSDHADWDGLLNTVRQTGAETVYVTHGFQSVFSRYLNELNIRAAEVKTEFGQEEEGAEVMTLPNAKANGEQENREPLS